MDKNKKLKGKQKGIKKKIEGYTKSIRDIYDQSCETLRTSTDQLYRMGQKLQLLKDALIEIGQPFGKFIKNEIPYLNIRTAERYMRLAKKGKIDEYPSLAHAGIVRLLELDRISGDYSVDKFLKNNKIEIFYNTKDKAEVREFLMDIDKLINKHKVKPINKDTNDHASLIKDFADSLSTFIDTLKMICDGEDVSEQIDGSILDETIEKFEEGLFMFNGLRDSILEYANTKEEYEVA